MKSHLAFQLVLVKILGEVDFWQSQVAQDLDPFHPCGEGFVAHLKEDDPQTVQVYFLTNDKKLQIFESYTSQVLQD